MQINLEVPEVLAENQNNPTHLDLKCLKISLAIKSKTRS